METTGTNSKKEIIEKAISEHSPSVTFESATTLNEVNDIIRVFMRKHPEIFWFSNQYDYDAGSGMLVLKYNFTKEKTGFIEKQIEKILTDDFQTEHVKTLPEIERLVYVYKWIAGRTTYNEFSSFNQTIYSVLVNRNSVCTGYAKTAQYLLASVGIESELVFGKFHCDNSEHGRHGWNVVKIDGSWYHVDFCLADRSLRHLLNENEPIIIGSILYNYFGVPTAKILRNRSIEYAETLPECNKTIPRLPSVEVLAPKKQLICCKSNSGASADIYLNSFNKNTVFKIPRNRKYDEIVTEASILKNLSGRSHVIKSYGISDSGLELEQLTPWCELLESHYYNLTEPNLRDILQQLIKGLIECRNNRITYYDIHPNNVFVSKDGTFKWGDFGLAFKNRTDGLLPTEMSDESGKPKGSYWFMAPETFKSNYFTESSAIYSVAMMAYFIMNGTRPPFWTDEEHQHVAFSQRITGRDLPAPVFANRFRGLWNIIHNALSFPAKNRPQSYEEFLARLNGRSMAASATSIAGRAGDFAKTRGCFNTNKEIDSYASTCQPTGKSRKAYDLDTFASTAASPGSSVWPQSKPDESYQPQKNYSSRAGAPKPAGRKWWKFWKSQDNDSTITEPEEVNEISACVYAPAQIRHNKTFIIRVYLYKPEEVDAVDAKISNIDNTAQKKEYKPLDIPVKKNDKLTVQLKMSEGVTLDSDTKSVVWQNHFTDCSFMVRLTDLSADDVFGTAYVYVNGIPAGELLFTVDVVNAEEKNLYANVESRRYSRIFISYSHADEVQVRGFAECCRALGSDYFFDRHTLQPGDVFKDKIIDYIDNADLFVLCWSKNAAESEWVRIEREHALSLIRKGKTNLSIYPLSLRPEAPLPPDMSDKYNFGTL